METLENFADLKELGLQAADDELGKIRDAYFDCETWRIRYIAVNEGFLQRHRVHLIPAVALGDINKRSHELMVQLTRNEVLRSPAIDERSILDRQVERAVYDYYGWPVYWEHEHGPQIGSAHSREPLVPPATYEEGLPPSRVLCKLSQIEGCRMRIDGTSMGQVTNILVDVTRWQVTYLQVEPGADEAQWVDPQKIQYVDWAGGQIVADPRALGLANR